MKALPRCASEPGRSTRQQNLQPTNAAERTIAPSVYRQTANTPAQTHCLRGSQQGVYEVHDSRRDQRHQRGGPHPVTGRAHQLDGVPHLVRGRAHRMDGGPHQVRGRSPLVRGGLYLVRSGRHLVRGGLHVQGGDPGVGQPATGAAGPGGRLGALPARQSCCTGSAAGSPGCKQHTCSLQV